VDAKLYPIDLSSTAPFCSIMQCTQGTASKEKAPTTQLCRQFIDAKEKTPRQGTLPSHLLLHANTVFTPIVVKPPQASIHHVPYVVMWCCANLVICST
jgi:hypothetical protein